LGIRRVRRLRDRSCCRRGRGTCGGPGRFAC
jgi:hypothetical protein